MNTLHFGLKALWQKGCSPLLKKPLCTDCHLLVANLLSIQQFISNAG